MRTKKKAWVIAVDMGYGHQRAAYPLKDIAFERIITANSERILTPREKGMWLTAQRFYETVTGMGLLGKTLFPVYEKAQKILPLYPFRDLSKPNFWVRQLAHLIEKGFCKSIIDYIKRESIPFISTFFVPALAASYHHLKDVYCVVTDSDVNRIWVAEEPKKSNIKYLVPCNITERRLKEYGVPEENIFLTGFPLPKENLGGKNLNVLKRVLWDRLPNLDPRKIYLNRYKTHIEEHLGGSLKKKSSHPLTITFVVGGTGVQKEIGVLILESLKKKIMRDEVKINLCAGTRLEIVYYFEKAVKDLGLKEKLNDKIDIIFALTKKAHFTKFNNALHTTDILWTKPSELCFYTALGLPIIMSPPIGAQEERNKKWILQLGSGFEQEDPEYTHEWLFDWLEQGILAEAAWEGFMEAPKTGTYNIEKIVLKK